jgi:hypothetical protein
MFNMFYNRLEVTAGLLVAGECFLDFGQGRQVVAGVPFAGVGLVVGEYHRYQGFGRLFDFVGVYFLGFGLPG